MTSPRRSARFVTGALGLAALAVGACAAPAAAQGAKLPSNYACSGSEPSWTLEVSGTGGTFTATGGASPEERRYRGQLTSVDAAATPFVVWRGRLDTGLREIVAIISQEECRDSASPGGPGSAKLPFAARVSLPQGEVRTGCCRPTGPDASFVAAGQAASPIGRVTGTVAYRPRVALTPDSVLKVALVEGARPDAEGVVLSEVSFTRPGQAPIAFELPYASARINPKRMYIVRATIEQAGEAKWVTTRSYPVITSDRPATVELVLDAPKTP